MRQAIFFTSLCICLSTCAQKQNQGETIIVDKDVEIPIKACVEANSKILGNSVNSITFCKCLIPKFYADLKTDPEKVKALKEGNWPNLSKEKQESISSYYESCISETATNDSTAKLTITPRMAEGMKKRWKQELIGSEIEQTNDIDKYCDCLIGKIQTEFTVKEIFRQKDFFESERYSRVVNQCLETTKRK